MTALLKGVVMHRLASLTLIWRGFATTWTLLLAVGCGDDPATPRDEPVIDDAESLVTALASAYRALDPVRYESLLANDPAANATFTFAVTDSAGLVHNSWDFDSETSIHHRMFEPDQIPDGDPPLDQALWVESIDVTLSKHGEFVERDEFYRSASNPGGVDPARWRVSSASYSTDVFFQPPEFVVNDGDAEFVVIEDLTKDVGAAAKFRLLAWTEPCAEVAIQSRRECWSTVKALYAK
jgi:hypothetical protein